MKSSPASYALPQACVLSPVSSVEWIRRDELHSNLYNPNHVAPPELELLEVSLLEDGWTQPIVIRSNNQIVDGFYRHKVSGSKKMLEKYGGYVPVVRLSDDKTLADQMLSTIRHNRARGVHGVLPMAQIVRTLKDTGRLTDTEIETRCGMEPEEIERLYDHAGMPERVSRKTVGYNQAWVPQRQQKGAVPGGEDRAPEADTDTED